MAKFRKTRHGRKRSITRSRRRGRKRSVTRSRRRGKKRSATRRNKGGTNSYQPTSYRDEEPEAWRTLRYLPG